MKKRSLSVLLTVAVIAVVILLNAVFSVLQDKYMWFVDGTSTKYKDDFYADRDLTPPTLYTLHDTTFTLIKEHAIPMVNSINNNRKNNEEAPITVNIKFCADRDTIYNSDTSRYIMYTALWLERNFPEHITVSFMNIEKNPALAQKYKVTSASSIYPSNVIVEFGTEYRVISASSFFHSENDIVTRYEGEYRFASAILAVTRAESPICCVTINHGEDIDSITSFLELVVNAGYIVQKIDLENEDIPENCRMIITYDPQTDFHGFGNVGESGISEIDKLDKFLDRSYSFMLFVDNETPVLTNLEEYIEEWGVVINRAKDSDGEDQAYHIRDEIQHVDKDGYSLLSNYATRGLGASITSDMRKQSYPAKIVFPNATSIGFAKGYSKVYAKADETQGLDAYTYANYLKNNVSRNIFDVFTASSAAYSEIDGKTYEVSTAENIFKLMTVTSESSILQEGDFSGGKTEYAYVTVCGSTEFISNEVLDSSAFGNADVMLSCLRSMGGEVIPVDIPFKAFKIDEISTKAYTKEGGRATMLWLAVIPAVLCFGTGIYITVKRKHS